MKESVSSMENYCLSSRCQRLSLPWSIKDRQRRFHLPSCLSMLSHHYKYWMMSCSKATRGNIYHTHHQAGHLVRKHFLPFQIHRRHFHLSRDGLRVHRSCWGSSLANYKAPSIRDLEQILDYPYWYPYCMSQSLEEASFPRLGWNVGSLGMRESIYRNKLWWHQSSGSHGLIDCYSLLERYWTFLHVNAQRKIGVSRLDSAPSEHWDA